MRTCVRVVVCLLFPRFELVVAAGGRQGLLDGPVALAPEPGREQLIGEVSASAQGYGIKPGMRLGEALGRCHELRLVRPDPMKVAAVWEHTLQALEGIGAAVDADSVGVVWFKADGLYRLHGGSLGGVIRVARQAVETPVRIGAAPTRFAALAAASSARPRRAKVAPDSKSGLVTFLAPLSVKLFSLYPETMHLPELLERFGVKTFGELTSLTRGALIERFGRAGERAYELARGHDLPLTPRHPDEKLEEALELPESACGLQLERALRLLIDRLLTNKRRQGRSIRTLVLSAALTSGGGWSSRVTFRQAISDSQRMWLALSTKLQALPEPANLLQLRVEKFGFAAGEQGVLLVDDAERMANLREGVRQAQAGVGVEAAMRVVAMDLESRLPERQFALTPWQES
jgi:protein ImuB